MNNRWLKSLSEKLNSVGDIDAPHAPTSSIWRGLAGHSPEMADVQEEVAADQMGRVALVSRVSEENPALLARLRGDAPVTPEGVIDYEGFFTLVHLGATQAEPNGDGADWVMPLPGEDAIQADAHPVDLLAHLTEADLLLYVVRAEDDWDNADAQWTGRLRAAHAPLLPVLTCGQDANSTRLNDLCARLRARMGVRPVIVRRSPEQLQEEETPPDLLELVERMLSLRPRLAIPLAQESPACRAFIARRVIRTGAWMSGLLGLEPIPILDLPLHVAVQWKVALQLAAIYGRPGLDVRSREMMSTLLVSASVRYVAQQLIKLIPVIGWLLSGLLSGVSTWLLGSALARYYEEERLLATPDLGLSDLKERIAPRLAAVHWPRGVGARLPWPQRATTSRNGSLGEGEKEDEGEEEELGQRSITPITAQEGE